MVADRRLPGLELGHHVAGTELLLREQLNDARSERVTQEGGNISLD